MFNHIGVLVDGRAEELFFRATLPGSRVRRNLPNGRDVSVELIFEAIRIGHETFGGSVETVIAKLDREQRMGSAADFVQGLQQMIEDSAITRPTIIAVADRCLENWILADDEMISAVCGSDYDYRHEGSMGKPILKSALRSSSVSFVRTSKLLISASAQRIRIKSDSFSRFHDDINFDWPWLRT